MIPKKCFLLKASSFWAAGSKRRDCPIPSAPPSKEMLKKPEENPKELEINPKETLNSLKDLKGTQKKPSS